MKKEGPSQKESTTKNYQPTIYKAVSDKVKKADLSLDRLRKSSSGVFEGVEVSDEERGESLALYCRAVVEFLTKEVEENNLDMDKVKLLFPGRSGLGLETSVREAVGEIFGKCPTSIRLPTDSHLGGSNEMIQYDKKDDIGRMVYDQINFSQKGPANEWDRDKMKTERLDRLFDGKTQLVLACDTDTARHRTLKQVAFVLSDYDIDRLVFARGESVHQKQNPTEDNYEPEVVKDPISIEPLEVSFSIRRLDIPIPRSGMLDLSSKLTLFKATGLAKKPAERQPKDHLSKEEIDIGMDMENILYQLQATDSSTDEQREQLKNDMKIWKNGWKRYRKIIPNHLR